ncbi:MAG: DNA glycosylase AlkZ-like family protein, partial [Candidatus Limnocylindria bacterium]
MPPPPPLTISAGHARRFLVRRHLLDPPRSLPAKPESVLKVIDRLGLLQFDPLEVPGARAHDLVLHARVGGYRREWCERWLYGPDRSLIVLYNKSLNIL